MAAPVGSTGCEGESDESSWQVGANYAYVVSRLHFDTGDNVELNQHAVLATLGYRIADQTTLQFGAGAVLSGELEADESYSLEPGPVFSATVSRQWLQEQPWFLVTSLSLGYSLSRAELPSGQGGRFSAADARLSVLGGLTLAEAVSPFLLARGFGGPVSWRVAGETRLGADRDHYALGAGVIARWRGLRLSVAGAALGERSISLGASWHF